VLLASGAEANANPSVGTPLHIASSRGDKQMAELLLSSKASVNMTNADGETPLHSAAPYPEMAKFLLANGADVSARSRAYGKLGATPLHYAILANNKQTVAVLIENKADPNAKLDLLYGGWIKGCTPFLI